jgi:hypothetical protein
MDQNAVADAREHRGRGRNAEREAHLHGIQHVHDTALRVSGD